MTDQNPQPASVMILTIIVFSILVIVESFDMVHLPTKSKIVKWFVAGNLLLLFSGSVSVVLASLIRKCQVSFHEKERVQPCFAWTARNHPINFIFSKSQIAQSSGEYLDLSWGYPFCTMFYFQRIKSRFHTFHQTLHTLK